MFTPNWEAFKQAVAMMILALPFMFGTLTLFALVTLGLTYLKSRDGKS
ncbi:MAG TPA: hypothetical protein VIL07_03895 [Symbiobacteriaceae bacterium]